jgi:hypothetical protein
MILADKGLFHRSVYLPAERARLKSCGSGYGVEVYFLKPMLPVSSRDTQLLENVLHQAPLGEGGLKKIEAHKGREQIPVGALKTAKNQGSQDKGSRNRSDIPLHGHDRSLQTEGLPEHSLKIIFFLQGSIPMTSQRNPR